MRYATIIPAVIVALSAAVTPAPISAAARQPPPYSQAQLLDYAAAFVELAVLRRIAEPRLQAASAAERPHVRAQWDAEIAKIMARHTLSAPRFNRISQAVDGDPVLRRTVRQLVMEKTVGF